MYVTLSRTSLEIMDDLFKITDQSSIGEQAVKFSIMLNEKHPIFEGHFPVNPILPGACLFFIIKKLASSYLQHKLSLKKCLRAKFTKLIHPNDQPVQVNLTIKEMEDAQYLIVATVEKEERCAHLKLLMTS